MDLNPTIQSIMTRKVVSVKPDTPLQEAAELLARHGFDGMPVVDEENKLVGILTEYDLISKGSAVHLPTFQKVIENLGIYHKDKSRFNKDFAELAALKVKDVMNNDPLTLVEDATYEEAVAAFREHHRVNPMPVIDQERKVVGVVSRFDILKPLHLLSR